ncbi:pyridoxamine 5'-phosphate oxidase family protein [Halomarina litorea]|uniref:pyridoxamine 5'-phosphate oxidase family protein n=1 Tax=Halomarina litorea TaxID=2961595 RepID=UPI0020C375BA|nr:pyridoxamine 5'-phosphate oxidase family protein [Halomarina sp. BCD28]
MSAPEAVEELVRDAPLSAFLATSVDDRPHVAPVWYDYRDGVVSILTGGKKLRNVRANPRVSLAIEDAHGPDVRWRVVVFGTARVVEDPAVREEVGRRISEKYRGEETDGGDPGGLVQVRVGSASVERY